MRGWRAAGLALVASAGSGVAFAQQEDTPFIRQVMAAAGPCSLLPPKSATPANDLAICQKAVEVLGAMDGPLAAATGHERNFYLIGLTSALTAVGTSMVQIDGVRSSRACEQMEGAWTIAALLDARVSPASYAAAIQQVRDDTARVARLCRSEKGTPAGATPLP